MNFDLFFLVCSNEQLDVLRHDPLSELRLNTLVQPIDDLGDAQRAEIHAVGVAAQEVHITVPEQLSPLVGTKQTPLADMTRGVFDILVFILF